MAIAIVSDFGSLDVPLILFLIFAELLLLASCYRGKRIWSASIVAKLFQFGKVINLRIGSVFTFLVKSQMCPIEVLCELLPPIIVHHDFPISEIVGTWKTDVYILG